MLIQRVRDSSLNLHRNAETIFLTEKKLDFFNKTLTSSLISFNFFVLTYYFWNNLYMRFRPIFHKKCVISHLLSIFSKKLQNKAFRIQLFLRKSY